MHRYTDLEFKHCDDQIVLVQPGATMLNQGGSIPDNDVSVEKAFRNTTSLIGLFHICTFSCLGQDGEFGGPQALGPRCGGLLSFGHARLPKDQPFEEGVEIMITCSNPECGMRLTSTQFPDRSALSNLMFYLALKQMIPGIDSLNYVDCATKERDRKWQCQPTEVDYLRSLGLISFCSEAFYGTMNEKHFGPFPTGGRDFSLGFMLVPGMRTMDGCGGFDKWLKFLVVKKFESLRRHHHSMLPFLLGPKPFRRAQVNS